MTIKRTHLIALVITDAGQKTLCVNRLLSAPNWVPFIPSVSVNARMLLVISLIKVFRFLNPSELITMKSMETLENGLQIHSILECQRRVVAALTLTLGVNGP